MKLAKRSLLIVLSALSIYFIIPITSADAATSPQWPIRPTNYGEYDGNQIHDLTGGKVSIRLWQQGIHRGEQAYTRWVLRDMSTGKAVRTTYVNGDFNDIISWTGIPYGDYTLTWTSLTNNDTEGWYYVVTSGGTIMR